jgi:hypothetical protein
MPRRPDPRPWARHKPWGNGARIKIDAMIDVIDEQSGAQERFYLVAPCRGEWMYVEDNIFIFTPEGYNTEYRAIFSRTETRIVSRDLAHTAQPMRASLLSDSFNDCRIEVQTYPETRLLETNAEVIQATLANIPLVARTEIADPQRKQRFVLEYPVNTMNIHPPRQLFQVDAGPLIVPDFASTAEKMIERLELAHVVYHQWTKAEFILRRPTPLKRDGQEVYRVMEYSEARAYPAKNQILAAHPLP